MRVCAICMRSLSLSLSLSLYRALSLARTHTHTLSLSNFGMTFCFGIYPVLLCYLTLVRYDSEVDGWKFYDVKAEYKRFGVPNDQWDATHVNTGYDVCPTYTRHLYAPAALSPSTIAGSAKYRSKGK